MSTGKIWNQLSEVVYRLVQQKKTDSDEFKALLSFYGREKLLTEYRKQVEIEKQKTSPPAGESDGTRSRDVEYDHAPSEVLREP